MAFLFDRRKVRFTGLACEIVLPDPRGRERALQLARTPYLYGFEVGWAKLDLVTVHIYYGRATANDPRRVQEIEDLAQLLGKRARQKKRPTRSGGDDGELILLGDFNIFNHGDATMAALEGAGLVIPEALRGDGPDAGPPVCSDFRDTGADGRPQRAPCTRDEDCPLADPAMVCGGDGFCECSVPAPAGGCSVGTTRPSSAWALVAIAAWVWARSRRRV